jgi:phospholipid transport system substrate-binding protein
MNAASRRAVLGPLLVPAWFGLAGWSGATWAQGDANAVRQPIITLYDALDSARRAGRGKPFRQRFDALAPVIEQVFDLETILKVSVGLRWNSLDASARSALSEAFRRFTIASYVANFDKYDGGSFEVLPTLRVVGNDQVVQTRIVPANGSPMPIDYVMQNGSAGWRVVDVLLNGSISRVAVQRSDFRGLLASGDTAALIESLQKKTADLAGGALG